jgi:HK97 family phage major capsid protein
MSAIDLRRKATEAREKIAALVAKAESENRELTDDENGLMEGWDKDAVSLEKRAGIVEKVDADLAKSRQSNGRTSAPLSGREVETETLEATEGEGDKRRSFGEFLADVAMIQDRNTLRADYDDAQNRVTNLYRSNYRDYRGKKNAEGRALTATTGASGGFTIPDDFRAEILQYAAPLSIVRPRATIIPMNGLTVEIPQLDAGTVPTGGSAHFGGVLMKWTGESEAKPSTEPVFKQLKLTAHELSGYCPVSRVVLQKSPISMDAFLFRMFGESAAREEDRAFFLGNGSMKPKGVLTAECLISTSARGSASAISYANALSVWTRVCPEFRANAVWVMSQAAEATVLAMAGVSNGVFIQTSVNVPSNTTMNAGPPGVTLFNRPVLVASHLPALNVAGDFGCYDFSQYLIGDPGIMEVATSEHYLFNTNQVAFRLIHYVAGAPWPATALTLDDGSTTVGPFVSLAIQ